MGARGRLDSAYVQYRQAVNLSPGRVEYRFSLAPIVQKLGDLAGALAQYDTMIQLAPDNAAVRHNRSVALTCSAGFLKRGRNWRRSSVWAEP